MTTDMPTRNWIAGHKKACAAILLVFIIALVACMAAIPSCTKNVENAQNTKESTTTPITPVVSKSSTSSSSDTSGSLTKTDIREVIGTAISSTASGTVSQNEVGGTGEDAHSSGYNPDGSNGNASGGSDSGDTDGGSDQGGFGEAPADEVEVPEKRWVVDYKEVWVEDSAAWDEQVLEYGYVEHSICNICGADITGNEAAHGKAHMLAGEGGGHHNEYVQVVIGSSIVHHEAVGHYETVEDGHWE